MARTIDLQWLAAGAFFGGVAAVASVGLVSWRRTTPLRRARDPPHGPVVLVGTVRTSLLTLLPGGAGLAALGWSTAGDGLAPPTRLLLGVGGALVAVSGFLARVVSIDVAPDGLIIRYSCRPPSEFLWRDCHRLQAPRWPLGGWRLHGPGFGRTLMPSDLWGHEWVLVAAVVGARLEFRAPAGWSKRERGGDRQPDSVIVPVICTGCTSQWK
jgi:hypothetical protein